MNDTLQQVVRAIGTQPLVGAAENCLTRDLLDPDEEHPTLLSLLSYLVTADHRLLEDLARSELRISRRPSHPVTVDVVDFEAAPPHGSIHPPTTTRAVPLPFPTASNTAK